MYLSFLTFSISPYLNFQCDNERQKVMHYWYTAWPDHKTPGTGKQLLMLATDVEMMRRKCGDIQTVDLLQQGQEQSQLPKGPVVVHCRFVAYLLAGDFNIHLMYKPYDLTKKLNSL